MITYVLIRNGIRSIKSITYIRWTFIAVTSNMTHVGGVCFLPPYYSRVRRINNLSSITIIRQLPRPVTRYISALEYTDRVHKANALLKEQCAKFNSTYLRQKGFTNCTDNIFLDGVHLHSHGMRQ